MLIPDAITLRFPASALEHSVFVENCFVVRQLRKYWTKGRASAVRLMQTNVRSTHKDGWPALRSCRAGSLDAFLYAELAET